MTANTYDGIATALGIQSMTMTNSFDPNTTIYTTINNNSNLCPKCGELNFNHPRMGISHACNVANIQFHAASQQPNTAIVNAVPVNQLEDDTQAARENILDVMQKTSDAVTLLAEIAKDSQHPRAFEVLGQLLKVQSEASDQLLKAHKMRKDINTDTYGDGSGSAAPASSGVSIDKAIFVGTNAELLDLIKGKSHKIIEHDDLKD